VQRLPRWNDAMESAISVSQLAPIFLLVMSLALGFIYAAKP
jgi:hypothetical protein